MLAYRQSMPRFSLKTMLLSAALIAVGLCLGVLPFRFPTLVESDPAAFVCLLGSAVFIGAGVGVLIKQPWAGALGGLAGLAILYVFALAFVNMFGFALD